MSRVQPGIQAPKPWDLTLVITAIIVGAVTIVMLSGAAVFLIAVWNGGLMPLIGSLVLAVAILLAAARAGILGAGGCLGVVSLIILATIAALLSFGN